MTENNQVAQAAAPKTNASNGPAAVKPEKSGSSKKWLIGCGIALLVLILCCVVTFCLASMAGPSQLAGMFTSDQPLDIQAPEALTPAEREAFQEEMSTQLSSGNRVTLNPETITQLMYDPADTNQNQLFQIDINEEGKSELDLSFETEPGRYVNIQAVADIEIQDSMFTKFVINELTVGSFDVGMLLQGQDLAANINADMQTQGNDLQGVKYFGVENGEFVVELDSTFFDQAGLDSAFPEGIPSGFEMPAELGQ